MSITPSVNGFLKGLLFVVILSVVSYLGDSAHLSGVLTPVLATLVASLFSALESSIKAKTGNGLLGAVRVKRPYT